jgi:uncharacterized protein YdeI (YjbR/CyaY-like superfamily)
MRRVPGGTVRLGSGGNPLAVTDGLINTNGMSAAPATDPRVDAYIARAAPFAQPILQHLRALVHEACPTATETMKWSMPHFEHAGKILCGMAAFKAHCTFGFWHKGMEKVVKTNGAAEQAMGTFGRITSLKDLPADKTMIGYVRAAVKLNESGAPGRPRPAATGPKKDLPVPEDLAAALKKSKTAAKTFAEFSPSHRKEYIEWITEAKRAETRAKRLETTLEWLGEGKARHWKYQNC